MSILWGKVMVFSSRVKQSGFQSQLHHQTSCTVFRMRFNLSLFHFCKTRHTRLTEPLGELNETALVMYTEHNVWSTILLRMYRESCHGMFIFIFIAMFLSKCKKKI